MSDDQPNPLPPATVPVLDEHNSLTLPWRRALQNVGQAATGGITQLTGDVLAGPGGGVQPAALSSTGVTPGAYINPNLTINAQGRVVNASNGAAGESSTFDPLTLAAISLLDGAITVTAAYTLARPRTFTYTGDATGGPTTFNGSANVSTALTLANIVSAATNTKITFNAKGQVTAGTQAVLASADYANQGTTTTVLHGNAAGNPSFAAVSLITDVTGNLPVTNLNSGTLASATTFWCGDGTWKTASAAGGGTVTSVDISSANLTVGGGPITSSGTLTVALPNTAVTPGSYTNTNLTVDATGRITAASNGSAGAGTVTTTGSPASGNLTKFSGATSITNGDLSGDVTTSGALVTTIKTDVALAGNPTTTTQATSDSSTRIATTAYVTTGISNAIAGVNPAVAVQAATTAAADTSGLTYSNGVSGVGATFTGPVNTALTVDGYTFTALGQRLLVKNDTQSPSGAFNGVYYVTQVQTALLPLILTRTLDYNQPSDINNTGAIPVINGTLNADTSWLLTSTVNTVGTDPLTYIQFTVAPTGAALSVLGVAGNASAIRADIAAGVDGYVLRRSGTALGFGTVDTAGITNSAVTLAKIANATNNNRYLGVGSAGSGAAYTENTFTAGTGVTITNGASGITIAATGTVAGIASATISTAENTSSTTYVDLATAGPSVTLTTGTSVLITMCSGSNKTTAGAGNNGFVSVAVSGATTLAANDGNGFNWSAFVGGGFQNQMSRTFILSGLTAGSNTFKLQYRVNGATFQFSSRDITIMAL